MSFVSLTNYILVDKKVVREMNPIAWSSFHEDMENRRVKLTTVDEGSVNEVTVSTVFLGVDHSYGSYEKDMKKEGYQPVIFETLLISADHKWHDIQKRYKTWDESLLGHAILLKRVMRDRVKFKIHRSIYL